MLNLLLVLAYFAYMCPVHSFTSPFHLLATYSLVDDCLSLLLFWIAYLASLLCICFVFNKVLIQLLNFGSQDCPISPSILSIQYK